MKKQALSEETENFYPKLRSTQEWFAGIITQPLEDNQTIRTYTTQGYLVAEETAKYIVPSTSLSPHQRIQIYNQQYWWRLLNTLHTNFPLATRLFGYHAFNEKIGIPYLLEYPPHHWSLNLIGTQLPDWVSKFYHHSDKSLIVNAVKLDGAFMDAFIAPQNPSLSINLMTQQEIENLLSQTLYLQPHIHLFSWDYDLLAFRESFLKQPVEYWTEHPFPEILKGKTNLFVVYRNLSQQLAWQEISKGAFSLLECFKKGISIANACEYIETQEESLYEEITANLQKWLQDWTQSGWLTLTHPLG